MVKFTANPTDTQLIRQIADRVAKLGNDNPDAHYPRMDILMDLEAVHSNGCPLDFNKLMGAPNFDFAHDIYGIRAHIDRTTGKLDNHFLPRCARNESTNPKLRIKIGECCVVLFITAGGDHYYTDRWGQGLWHEGALVNRAFSCYRVARATMRRRFLKLGLVN